MDILLLELVPLLKMSLTVCFIHHGCSCILLVSFHINKEGEPSRPQIHYDYLYIEVNSSFEIECQADVGFPPKQITWMYKFPNTNDFQVVEIQHPQVQVSAEDCHIIARKSLTIFMDHTSSKAVYRCSFQGYDYTDEKYYDEVSVQLPKVELDAVSDGQHYHEDVRCLDDDCIAESREPTNSATSLSAAVRTTLLAAILVSL